VCGEQCWKSLHKHYEYIASIYHIKSGPVNDCVVIIMIILYYD